jgi:hypothetical protein
VLSQEDGLSIKASRIFPRYLPASLRSRSNDLFRKDLVPFLVGSGLHGVYQVKPAAQTPSEY